MIYDSPFNIGDKVFHIRKSPNTYWEDCELCNGTGSVQIGDQNRVCPDCYGRCGNQRYELLEWQTCRETFTNRDSGKLIVGPPERLTIGQIRLEADKQKIEWIAMCLETGVGSGTLHNMADMFSTAEEAEQECKKRNATPQQP